MMTMKLFFSKRLFPCLPTCLAAALLGLGTVQAADYALSFDGTQSVDTQVTGDKLAGNELTIEYWFKGPKMLSAVRLQLDAGSYIVAGWGGGVGTNNPAPMHLLKTGSQEFLVASALSSAAVQDGNWHHVAFSYKRNATNGFNTYLDGNLVVRQASVDQPIPTINGKVWLGSINGTDAFMIGALDEVCIWKRALSDAEILDRARNPRLLTGREPSLTAYFRFNETGTNAPRDLVSGQYAILKNMTASARIAQTNVSFGIPASAVAAAGLWLGEVSLQRVNEVTGSNSLATTAGGQFDFNIILHADSNGVVRLLKDVTMMQKRNTASNLTDVVLLTDDTLIPNYDGVIKRAGKLVGVRYSSPFFQFDGQSVVLAGGLGLGNVVIGTNLVSATLPTNPFRHKYHPNHKDPRDLQNKPYDVERQIEITFDSIKTGVSEGRDLLKGTYRETIKGLHKIPLVTEGTISLQRISLVNKLNNQ